MLCFGYYIANIFFFIIFLTVSMFDRWKNEALGYVILFYLIFFVIFIIDTNYLAFFFHVNSIPHFLLHGFFFFPVSKLATTLTTYTGFLLKTFLPEMLWIFTVAFFWLLLNNYIINALSYSIFNFIDFSCCLVNTEVRCYLFL